MKEAFKAVFCDIQSVETHFSVCMQVHTSYVGCVLASCHCAFNEYGHLGSAPQPVWCDISPRKWHRVLVDGVFHGIYAGVLSTDTL